MKINPVQGPPTIPNPGSTGLSPERLAAIKALASKQDNTPTKEVEAPKEEVIELGQTPTHTTQRIKMHVNRSHTMPIEAPMQENAPLVDSKTEDKQELVTSDKDVQQNQAKPDSAEQKPVASGTVSPELAQLAKERRALQIEREQLEKLKAEAPKETGETKDQLIARLKSNALSVLQEHGVTYEQLTNEILGQPPAPPDLTKFEENILKKIDEKLAGKDSQQEEAVYTYMKQEVDKLSNLVPYKFIKENNAQDKVMDLVKRMWREQGEILTETEAMDLIEAELREDAKRYARLIGEVEPTTPPEETPPVQATAPKQVKTLTNKDSARPAVTRRQRALAAAMGQKLN